MARKPTREVLLRKRSDGSKVWALRFRAYGKRRYVALGTDAEGWDRPRAEEELQNVLADVRRGVWKPHERVQHVEPTPEPTFHEFASEWFASQEARWAEKTRGRYRWQLSSHLLPFFQHHRLSEIGVAEVDRYRDLKVREGSLSADTINGTLARLGQVLDVADERGLIERNPLRVNPKRRKLKAAKPRAVWLDRAEQITTLLDAASELDAEARPDRKHVGRRALIGALVFGDSALGSYVDCDGGT